MAITLNGTTGITTPKLDALDLELGSKNVVERGSNANGEYVRFADGTQICTHTVSFANISSTIGQIFASPSVTWTFPGVFATTPSVSVQESSGMQTTWGGHGIDADTTTTASLRMYRPSSLASAGTSAAVAIGRWY